MRSILTKYFRWQRERRGGSGGHGSRFRPDLEALEERALLSVYTVDRLTDLGEGSDLAGDLRYCITQANATPEEDTITFGVTGTINLTMYSSLPNLTGSVAIEGPGADLLTIDARHLSGVFTVADRATALISGLTIAHGSAAFGGGIFNAGTLMVSNSTLSGNWADEPGGMCDSSCSGGGILNGGTAIVSSTTLDGNEGPNGGGISNFGTLTVSHSTLSGNRAGSGGGIYNRGTLTVSHSTLSENDGHGIFNFRGTVTLSRSTVSGNTRVGVYNLSGMLTVANSTISGNRSTGFRSAGGIVNTPDFSFNATVQLVNTTIADNTATSSDRTGSQIYTGRTIGGTGQAMVLFRNTIVSGGGGRPNFFADVGGTFISEGHNLSNDDSGNLDPKLGDLPSTDPQLGPLQDNGGPTFTHALLPGSPALEAGDNTDAPEFDQRGLPRIVAETIDIGAFEVQPGPLASFAIIPDMTEVPAGTPVGFYVVALDAYGHVVTDYVGEVTFASSDPEAALPVSYTFQASNSGVAYFADGVTFARTGAQGLYVIDTATYEVLGSALFEVLEP
jgi:hypothetical protein